MSKHSAARVLGAIATFTALMVLSAVRALAAADPGLGEGSGSAPPTPPPSNPGFEILGMAWQPALAVAVALVAVIGLVASLQHRRHAAGMSV